MADGLTVIARFPRGGECEDADAETYWDKIKPTLITADEYFRTAEPREEWLKRREAKALSALYGAEVEVSVKE